MIDNFKDDYSKYRRKKLLDILETMPTTDKEKLENEFKIYLQKEQTYIFSHHYKEKKSIYEFSIVKNYFYSFCSKKLLDEQDDFISFVKRKKSVSISEIGDNKYEFDSLEELKSATLQLKLF